MNPSSGMGQAGTSHLHGTLLIAAAALLLLVAVTLLAGWLKLAQAGGPSRGLVEHLNQKVTKAILDQPGTAFVSRVDLYGMTTETKVMRWVIPIDFIEDLVDRAEVVFIHEFSDVGSYGQPASD